MATLAQYVIASQEGMTPFATAANKKEAQKFSRQARMLGFSGRIVFQPPTVREDLGPPVMIQIGDRTFRISKFKEHGYSICRQRANGSWQRWMRLHHLNDQGDVETLSS